MTYTRSLHYEIRTPNALANVRETTNRTRDKTTNRALAYTRNLHLSNRTRDKTKNAPFPRALGKLICLHAHGTRACVLHLPGRCANLEQLIHDVVKVRLACRTLVCDGDNLFANNPMPLQTFVKAYQ